MKRIRELKRVDVEQTGEKWTDQASFLQAYQHGDYHEEEPIWYQLALSLSDKEIEDIALFTIHWLIVGSVETRSGERLDTLMTFHEQMVDWLQSGLEAVPPFLELLDRIKAMIIEAAEQYRYPEWAEALRQYSVLHIGLLHRMRLKTHSLQEDYNHDVERIIRLCDKG